MSFFQVQFLIKILIFYEDIFDNFHPLCRKSNLDLGLVSNSTLISTQSGHKNWSETSLVIDEKTNFDVGTWETRNENDCD